MMQDGPRKLMGVVCGGGPTAGCRCGGLENHHELS